MTAAEEALRIENQRIRDAIWRQLVDQMTANGVPLHEAREGADLAIHACEQAKRRLIECCMTAREPIITMLAVQIAAQILPTQLEGLNRNIQETVSKGDGAFQAMVTIDTGETVQ